jgi:myo-inositol-1(or 4)-monophosphatase
VAVRSALFNVMSAAALKAARGLKRDFGEVEQLQVSVKGPGDFVSTADLKAERVLCEELEKARPGFGFLMEESGESKGRDSRHRWIVDPLDGTTNFLHGVPHWAISIGLEQDGEMVAGLVYAPIADEMFFAEKGGGAYLNDRRLRVSARRKLEESLIGTGIPFAGHGDHPLYLRTLAAVMGTTTGARRLGVASLDLAYVAAGRFDGFWEFGLKPWDMAGGLVLVREAGGTVAGLSDGNFMASGDIIAVNQALYQPLRELLMGAIEGAG